MPPASIIPIQAQRGRLSRSSKLSNSSKLSYSSQRSYSSGRLEFEDLWVQPESRYRGRAIARGDITSFEPVHTHSGKCSSKSYGDDVELSSARIFPQSKRDNLSSFGHFAMGRPSHAAYREFIRFKTQLAAMGGMVKDQGVRDLRTQGPREQGTVNRGRTTRRRI